MAKKPTYKELEQKVKALDKNAADQQRLEGQKETLLLAIEQSVEAIALSDLDGNLEYLNPSFAKIHGYSPEELIGKHLSIFHTARQMPFVKKANKQVKKTGSFKGELCHVTRDGMEFPTLMYNSLVRDNNGNPIAMAATLRDITERKKYEKTLRENEQEKETVLNSLLEHVVYQNTEMRILWANRAACESVNLTQEELVGRFCYEIWSRRSQPCSDCPVLKAMKTGQPEEKEKYTPDGKAWFVRGYPVRDANGKIVGAIGLALDITKAKQAEKALRESEERYRNLFNTSADGILVVDSKTKEIIYTNRAISKILGYEATELINMIVDDIHPKESLNPVLSEFEAISKEQKTLAYEVPCLRKDGRVIYANISSTTAIVDGKKCIIGFIRDITEYMKIKEALQKAHNKLERRVKERTRELEAKTEKFEELNIALKVLLSKREEDKKKFEEDVLSNVNNLILPYLNKLKEIVSDPTQKIYIEVLETNVNEIISPFANKLSLKYMSLTPAEIRVANLVKQGMRTKEIAKILDGSPKTIETHRENIRKKIGIRNKKANLRSHLLSFH